MVKGFVPQGWRLKKPRYNLIGGRCAGCDVVHFPAKMYCTSCGKDEIVEHVLGGAGVVVSFTTIHAPPSGYEARAPYVVAVVRLDEGPLITARLDEEPGVVGIGGRVVAAFRRLQDDDGSGVLFYGFVFVAL